MKEKIIKAAIIGCGRISGHHCRSIMQTEGIELLAVCDLDLQKANTYNEQFGGKPYSNYHQMLLENPKIDIVAIVTPSGMHYEHAIEIMTRYRKNIIVEKPTFMKPSQVREAYSIANEVGVQIFPIFQNRHNLAVTQVMDGLKSGELGKIRTAAVCVRWCRPQRYYDLAPWRGTFSMDGGCLTNQGIHHIDLLRLLGGEISHVCSVHRTMGAKIEVEDTAVSSLIFSSGAVGTIEITTAARPLDYEASLSLVCENGLAKIGGIAVNELQIYTPNPELCETKSEDFSGNVYGNGHLKIYKEIVKVLSEEQKYSIQLQDVLGTIQLLNSFYISDEKQNWVDVKKAGDSKRLGLIDNKLSDLYRINYPI